eukprot:GHVQ01013326.1.p1 GENE.GHVQ01013326.1~~GHVQ01013326.1.p1  ORF type:complete len:267 (-),score=11.47 GHVQ01013326.1:406-1206(-)
MVLIVVTLLYLVGLVFSTQKAVKTILSVDYYLTGVAVPVVVSCECLAVSWVDNFRNQIRHIGPFGPLCLGLSWLVAIICNVFIHWIPARCAAVFSVMLAGTIGSLLVCLGSEKLSYRQKAWWLCIGNIESLREDINALHDCDAESRRKQGVFSSVPIPLIWSMLIKFVVPSFYLCNALFFSTQDNLIYRSVTTVPGEYRVAGMTLTFLICFIVGTGLIFPQLFRCLVPTRRFTHFRGLRFKQKAQKSEVQFYDQFLPPWWNTTMNA